MIQVVIIRGLGLWSGDFDVAVNCLTLLFAYLSEVL